jgi:hypothetical protein
MRLINFKPDVKKQLIQCAITKDYTAEAAATWATGKVPDAVVVVQAEIDRLLALPGYSRATEALLIGKGLVLLNAWAAAQL